MAIPNIFSAPVTEELINRVNRLQPDTHPQWGKMSADQMLAHCNVSYEMAFENNHAKPNPFMRFILKALVKNKVVGESPYKRNSPTAPAFVMKGSKDFAAEKQRLIGYLRKTQELGANWFDGKESLSFGKLSSGEWSNMFYKHLNHHLSQFGV